MYVNIDADQWGRLLIRDMYVHSVQFNKKLSFKVSLEVSKNIFKSRLKVS